jgi:hypothetical protein
MDSNQREMYSTLICDSLNCDSSVKAKNDQLMNAAKIGAMALSIVPGVGPLISIGAYAALESAETIDQYIEDKDKLTQMKSSIASSGIDNKQYNQEIGDYIKNLSKNTEEVKLISKLASTIIIASVGMGKVGNLKKLNGIIGTELKNILKVEKLTPLQETMINKMSTNLVEKSTLTAKDIANGDFHSENFNLTVKETVLLLATVKAPVLKKMNENQIDGATLVIDSVVHETYDESVIGKSEFWSSTKNLVKSRIKK